MLEPDILYYILLTKNTQEPTRELVNNLLNVILEKIEY